MRPIALIVIHHSAAPPERGISDISRWHKDKGWTAIGYHFVIEQDGSRLPGRDLDRVGAHARGNNEHSIGICVTGDNTHPGREWNDRQRASLRELVAALRIIFPGAQVTGHRDIPGASTLCPGVDVASVLEGT